MGEMDRAEEVFRLGVQYAQNGPAAPEIFQRLGEGLLMDLRPGEAIGPLRRALALGASPKAIQPLLAKAYLRRHRYVAAYACLRSAMDAGAPSDELVEDLRAVEELLGPALSAWRARILTAQQPIRS
jgi:hypothetical protein